MDANQQPNQEQNSYPELIVIEEAIDVSVKRGIFNRAEVVLIDQCLKGLVKKVAEQAERIADLENTKSLITEDELSA